MKNVKKLDSIEKINKKDLKEKSKLLKTKEQKRHIACSSKLKEKGKGMKNLIITASYLLLLPLSLFASDNTTVNAGGANTVGQKILDEVIYETRVKKDKSKLQKHLNKVLKPLADEHPAMAEYFSRAINNKDLRYYSETRPIIDERCLNKYMVEIGGKPVVAACQTETRVIIRDFVFDNDVLLGKVLLHEEAVYARIMQNKSAIEYNESHLGDVNKRLTTEDDVHDAVNDILKNKDIQDVVNKINFLFGLGKNKYRLRILSTQKAIEAAFNKAYPIYSTYNLGSKGIDQSCSEENLDKVTSEIKKLYKHVRTSRFANVYSSGDIASWKFPKGMDIGPGAYYRISGPLKDVFNELDLHAFGCVRDIRCSTGESRRALRKKIRMITDVLEIQKFHHSFLKKNAQRCKRIHDETEALTLAKKVFQKVDGTDLSKDGGKSTESRIAVKKPEAAAANPVKVPCDEDGYESDGSGGCDFAGGE